MTIATSGSVREVIIGARLTSDKKTTSARIDVARVNQPAANAIRTASPIKCTIHSSDGADRKFKYENVRIDRRDFGGRQETIGAKQAHQVE